MFFEYKMMVVYKSQDVRLSQADPMLGLFFILTAHLVGFIPSAAFEVEADT